MTAIPRSMVKKVLDRDRHRCVLHLLCNGLKETVPGDALQALYLRGVKVKPDSTHAKSLERARTTEVIYPDGGVYRLTSTGERIGIASIDDDRKAD